MTTRSSGREATAVANVLISIRHKYAELILDGKKTVEVRKTIPHIPQPFRCLIYEPRFGGGCGMVVGEFICPDFVLVATKGATCEMLVFQKALDAACLTTEEAIHYADGATLSGWCVSEPVRYDDPIPLSAFGLTRPPQSWCYLNRKVGNG